MLLPKISIITVCKNAETTIEKTIQSVLEQSYSNIEYIVIDGASTDGTLAIIDKYADKISKVVSESDLGIFDAMNKGISLSSGELICFINASDFYISKYVFEFLINRIKFEQCDVFFAQIVWIDNNYHAIITTNHLHIYDKYHLFKECFPHPATFYKKEAFEKIGVFNIDYYHLADYEWNMRALIKCKLKFQYIDIIMSCFLTGGFSTIESLQANRREELRKLQKEYFTPLEIKFFNNTFFNYFYKYKVTSKLLRKFFKLKLNKTF